MEIKKKDRRGLLTPMELRYIAAWQGDNTAAAREAGFAHPKQAAGKLMKKPAVYRAIQAKQDSIITESGARLGKRLTKTDITDGILMAIARLEQMMKTACHRRQVQAADVQASARVLNALTDSYMALANLHGFLVSKNLNVDKMLEGRTPEEMDYFAIHGYWPNSTDPDPEPVQ